MAENERKETYRLGRWIVQEDWPLWLILAASFIVGLLVYSSLPDWIPIHWNLRGEIDGWGTKANVFLIPVMNVGLYLVFLVTPLIDPRRENYPRFKSTLRIFRWSLVVFMTAMWGISLAAAKGLPVDTSLVVPVMTSALFVVLGNLMSRLRYNWFFGIRTPWALSNEEAWRLTHRVGGRAWVIGGLISLVGAFFGGEVAIWAMGFGIGAASLFSVVYSYFAWKKTSGGKA
ncbi:MAG: SdpI family protein [Syntrophothermus sp.]